MDFVTSISFLGAIFIFMATPGPGVIAVISRALGSGFMHAFSMSAGMVLGDIVFLLLSIFGLSIIAKKFLILFFIIKLVGGVYLLYLGYMIFVSKTSHFEPKNIGSRSFIGDFFAGLFITLSNPKVIAFYVGFLPTFVDLANLTYRDTILVVSLVLVTLSSILLTYSYFASKAKETIKQEKTQKILNRIAGISMFAVGGLLVTSILKK